MAKIIRRYKSRIYGNYRIAYLKYGTYLGLAVSFVVLLQTLLLPTFQPYAPETFITDLVMMVGIALAGYYYRDSLSRKRVMFKELFLLGLGTGIIASLIYGLFVWFLCGQMFPDVAESFAKYRISCMPPAAESAEAQYNIQLVRKYTAFDWAFIGFFRTFVMSILIVFFVAIIFSNEKPMVYDPVDHHHHSPHTHGARTRAHSDNTDRNILDD